MDASLQAYPIPKGVKARVLNELWKPCRPLIELLSRTNQVADLSAYFTRYYSHHCQRFSRDGGIHISIKTHSEIIDIAKRILQDATRAMIIADLNSAPRNPEHKSEKDATATSVPAALILCARLITMCNFGDPEFGFSPRDHLPWRSHQTLRQALAEYFRPPAEKLQPDNPRLRRLFTARHLACIGGIRIRWTDNLMDHLLLSDDDRAVFIFHNVSFLRYQSWSVSQEFVAAAERRLTFSS